MLTRRRLFTLAAPAIVTAASLMKIKAWEETSFGVGDILAVVNPHRPDLLDVSYNLYGSNMRFVERISKTIRRTDRLIIPLGRGNTLTWRF